MATYYFRQNGQGQQGPFEEGRIAGWIGEGRVRADMEISGDGQQWMPVGEHRLYAAAPPFRAIAGPPPVRAAQPVEEVDEVEDVPEEPQRPRRSRRTAEQSAPAMTSEQAAGLGCLGLIVVAAIIYFASSGGDGKTDGPTDDRGVAVSTTSVPGVFRSHEVRDGVVTKEGFDTWLLLTPTGAFEWYEKRSDADDWQLRLSGTWSSEKRRYTDTGGEYLGVDLKGDDESLSFAFDDGALSMSEWSKGMQKLKGMPLSTTPLNKKSDSASKPSPIKAR